MSNTNTGGPAFPSAFTGEDEGMTLRDYFAAKAMQADMTGGVHADDFDWTATRAYRMADQMLKAREA
jgi:hypothetical protein